MDSSFFYYAIVLAFGAAVGTGELVSRYRDAPGAALKTPSAGFYITLNGAVALFALWLIRANDWTFGATAGDDEAAALRQTLVAGFGAMAFFRSSLFAMRVGDSDVQVGPSAFLQIILNAADRAVDRARAHPRAQTISGIMQDVRFDEARHALPAHCIALMQNVSADESETLGQSINGLAASDMSDDVKTLNLGLLLMNVVGSQVLKAAVDSLGDKIRGPTRRADTVSGIMDGVSFDKACVALPSYSFALHGNISDDVQAAFGAEVTALDNSDLGDDVKALHLGISLMDLVGEAGLKAAVSSLGEQLKG